MHFIGHLKTYISNNVHSFDQ